MAATCAPSFTGEGTTSTSVLTGDCAGNFMGDFITTSSAIFTGDASGTTVATLSGAEAGDDRVEVTIGVSTAVANTGVTTTADGVGGQELAIFAPPLA